MNKYGKDFMKILEHLKPSKNAYEVFNDWLVMSAASLYNTYKKDPEIEEEYMQVANQYKKDELDKHGQLLSITIEALEKTEKDFLGEIFTEAGLTNERNGQFFTPYNITLMMAQMIIGENKLSPCQILKINDPTCGAGGMLIAGAMVLKERGFDFQNRVLYIGQDIDARCARMAFIQLTLLGVPGVIYCMNTLTMQEYWHRETIGYYLADMDFRLKAERILELMREMESGPAQAEEEKEPEEKEPMEITLPRRELTQGELF